ncbi:cell surface glycoprotein CD200 receptor 1 isoform X1 [Tachysurus vachellii]|uniref:cell surface glycoprotein CD200 receptor 1 isoform X1 n=1 Tax=Tachysurus vachellii TaxID=175792 RepID=UPI00296B39D5|nr:cell surface glycoprotein CD200 receptor 1 isoform X1 [Tachysurus vachellii]
MELKLVLKAVLLFAVCITRSCASGADDKESLHANKITSAKEKLTVYRNIYVELGTTVTLTCTNTTITWHDMIFVIWKIKLRDKECTIAVAKNDSAHDTCLDGKKQNNTADGMYHLIIPNFSIQDEGKYTCDTSYQSGGTIEEVTVSGRARPQLTGWLEYEQGQTVAVCEATGKPAATIQWKTPWNSTFVLGKASENTGQLSTVVNRLHLPQHASYENLTCVATASDLKNISTQFSNFTFRDAHSQWPIIFVCVLAAVLIAFSLTGLYLCSNFKLLSIFRKLCCKPEMPVTNEEKPQQPYDPEELQPYASYVQRVNSIYNSSADLFKA